MSSELEKQQILKVLEQVEGKLETFRSRFNDLTDTSENMFSNEWWAVGAWEDAHTLASLMDEVLFWKQANEVRVASEEVPETSPVSKVQELGAIDRINLAKKLTTPIETLNILSKDEDVNVVMGVASNPSTPLLTLRILSKDSAGLIRKLVAQNPNTPIQILRVLAKDKHWYVREAVAKNPNWLKDQNRV